MELKRVGPRLSFLKMIQTGSVVVEEKEHADRETNIGTDEG